MIDLDAAATTPLRAEAAEALARAHAEAFGNPSSPHAAGRLAKRVLEDCRERMLTLLGGRRGRGGDRLVFTSGATEANGLALLGLASGGSGCCGFSSRDHSSVVMAARSLAARGWQVAELPLEPDGTLDLKGVAFDQPVCGLRLLATTLVCGQTGTIEDLDAVFGAVPRGTLLHVDATQAVRCVEVTFSTMPAATLTLAAHKIGGPRGIGALVLRGDVALEALVPGPQEFGLRGGTEPVPLVAAFTAALEASVTERRLEYARLASLRDGFETGIVAAARAAGLEPRVVAGESRRSPHISLVAFPGVDRQAVVMAADLEGVCCATGTACASGSSDPSPAVTAMGLSDAVARSAVRFSFGRDTSQADVAEAIERLGRVLHRVAGASGG
jgi:cysteine desulfurase